MATKRSYRSVSVTGRDGYILGAALVYAIAQIQRLPPEQQAWSDVCDMCRLLRTLSVHPSIVSEVQEKLGVEIDLDADLALS